MHSPSSMNPQTVKKASREIVEDLADQTCYCTDTFDCSPCVARNALLKFGRPWKEEWN